MGAQLQLLLQLIARTCLSNAQAARTLMTVCLQQIRIAANSRFIVAATDAAKAYVALSKEMVPTGAGQAEARQRFEAERGLVVAPAELQGFEANVAHYSSSKCAQTAGRSRPLILRGSDSPPEQINKII